MRDIIRNSKTRESSLVESSALPHPGPVTHSCPLIRPQGPSLLRIPSAASQAAEVPREGESFAVLPKIQVSERATPTAKLQAIRAAVSRFQGLLGLQFAFAR